MALRNIVKKISGFLEKYIYLLIALILFAIPFFWFDLGEVDYGGDSSRLYFFDPNSWLKNIGFYSVNTLNSLNTENPQFWLIPFLSLLLLIKKVLFDNPYLLNCAFSGLLLSGSFVFSYLSFAEIINIEKDKKKEYCAIVAGLFFIFSPLVTDGWLKALYSFNQILVYPLIFYLFIKYIKSQKIIYIFISLLVSFIFAVNFSFASFPWFLAFFFFSFVFLFWYSSAVNKLRIFLKGATLFLLLFLIVQAFQLIPQIANILSVSNPNYRAVFSKEMAVNRGLEYFLTIQAYTKLTYNLLNQVQFDLPKPIGAFEFGLKYRFLYYIYIFIVLAGAFLVRKKGGLRERKVYSAGLTVFLVLAFFMTANITHYLASFYKSLFSIPGFSMYRSFYSKFGMSFVFFYAILLSFSLSFVLPILKYWFLKTAVLLYLLFIIIFNGWPLISGMIVNSLLWQSENVKLPTEMNKKFLSYLKSVKQRKLDGRYLTFPLTNEEYQIVQGKNGGAYFGPSIVSILGGRNDFTGLGTFNIFAKEITNAIAQKDWQLLMKYFSSLNIRYITHNSDDYIYMNFPSYPYATVFKQTFPTNYSMKEFVTDLGYQPISQMGYFTTYVKDDQFLPHLYLTKSVYLTDWPMEILSKIYAEPNFNLRSAVYFDYQNVGKLEGVGNGNIGEDPFVKTDYFLQKADDQTVLEYKKISPVEYKVRVHGAKGKIHLVFLDIFDSNWQAYLSKPESWQFSSSELLEKLKTVSYEADDFDKQDQASGDELKESVLKGWVSTLGNFPDKTSPMKFISKNFQGTIQNDNLPSRSFVEVFLNKGKYQQISSQNHLQVNGYANSWVIDTSQICSGSPLCLKNKNNTYDFEVIIEFGQQKLFYYGSIISGMGILFCLLGILFFRKKQFKK